MCFIFWIIWKLVAYIRAFYPYTLQCMFSRNRDTLSHHHSRVMNLIEHFVIYCLYSSFASWSNNVMNGVFSLRAESPLASVIAFSYPVSLVLVNLEHFTVFLCLFLISTFLNKLSFLLNMLLCKFLLDWLSVYNSCLIDPCPLENRHIMRKLGIWVSYNRFKMGQEKNSLRL